MNKETYEALKRLIAMDYSHYNSPEYTEDRKQVEMWIDEVAKEYAEPEGKKQQRGRVCYCQETGLSSPHYTDDH